MNVLIVTPWDQDFGGVASVVGNLANHLRHRRHGIFFLHPSNSNRITAGITKSGFAGYALRLREPYLARHPVRSILSFFTMLPFTLCQIVYVLFRHRIDLINIHYVEDGFIYFAICRRILSTRLVTSIHGADFFPAGRPKTDYSTSSRLILACSDLIVAPSQAFLSVFLALFPQFGKKGRVIHNAVDLSEITRSSPDDLNSSRDRYILCVAAHNEKKGVDVLIRAFGLLRDAERLQLFLAGDGPLRRELEGLARSVGVDDRVRFLGWQDRKEVVELLHGCDLFVLPSRSEPFGIVILEAMACRKPVVASAVGGIPEIIKSGENGLLVEHDNPPQLAEAMQSVLRDASLYETLSRNGYQTVAERFCAEINAHQYEELFYALREARPPE